MKRAGLAEQRPHSLACRARIEEALGKEEEGAAQKEKYEERATRKMAEELERQDKEKAEEKEMQPEEEEEEEQLPENKTKRKRKVIVAEDDQVEATKFQRQEDEVAIAESTLCAPALLPQSDESSIQVPGTEMINRLMQIS